jgi:hypothetical protein
VCDFVSWFQKGDTVIFLTDDDLATKAGKKLKKELDDQFMNDIKGHGAIRRFYEINEWDWPEGLQQKECEDFSNHNNFPTQIVEAIKNCQLTQIGILPDCVFTKAGLVKVKADAEWEKAGAEWEKADAEWKKADAEWNKACAEWKKAGAVTKWKVFSSKNNRAKIWR